MFRRCFVLVLYGATGVEEARTQLQEHLPHCDISLDDDDDLSEDEDGLDEVSISQLYGRNINLA
jgi:hypothetical protein